MREIRPAVMLSSRPRPALLVFGLLAAWTCGCGGTPPGPRAAGDGLPDGPAGEPAPAVRAAWEKSGADYLRPQAPGGDARGRFVIRPDPADLLPGFQFRPDAAYLLSDGVPPALPPVGVPYRLLLAAGHRRTGFDFLKGSKGLRSVQVTQHRPRREDWATLGQVPGLRSLAYYPSPAPANITAGEIEELRHAAALRSFAFGDGGIDDAAIAALAGLPGLRRLSMARVVLDDDKLKAIARIPQLEALDLHQFVPPGGRAEDGVAAIAGHRNLREVWLDWAPTTARGVAALRGWVAYRGGAFTSDFDIPEEAFSALGELPGVEALSLGWQVGDGRLAAVARLKTLRELRLTQTAVTPAGLAALKGMGLARLEPPEGAMNTEPGFKNYLAAVRPPTHLTLPEGLSAQVLEGQAGLTSLTIVGDSIGPDGVAALAGLRSLRAIDLRRTALSPEVATMLAGLKDLQTVGLSRGRDLLPRDRYAKALAALKASRPDLTIKEEDE